MGQANVDWLVENGYRYLVVSRQRRREFDETGAVTVKQDERNTVKVQRLLNEDTGEVELHCHSLSREGKEQAMQDQACQRFEAGTENGYLRKPREHLKL